MSLLGNEMFEHNFGNGLYMETEDILTDLHKTTSVSWPYLFNGVAEKSRCLKRPRTTLVGAIVQMCFGMLLTKLGRKIENRNCKSTSKRGLQPFGSPSNLAQPYANNLQLKHMMW